MDAIVSYQLPIVNALLTVFAFHHTMHCMGMQASMEREQRLEQEHAARVELEKRFEEWAADFTNGAKLPVAWCLPYKSKELREAWDKGDDARQEFLLEVYRSRDIVPPYEYVRNIDQHVRDRYDSERGRSDNE